MSTTENPTPSAQDDIKTVLQDTLIEQVKTLLNFTKAEGFALQIPETDTLILVGRAGKIREFLDQDDVSNVMANPATGE